VRWDSNSELASLLPDCDRVAYIVSIVLNLYEFSSSLRLQFEILTHLMTCKMSLHAVLSAVTFRSVSKPLAFNFVQIY
jgi:hypothetical protein